MNKKSLPHIITAVSFVVFIVLGLASTATTSATSRKQPALDSATAYWQRGQENYKNGNFDLAVEDFTEVIRRSPNYAPVYNLRAWVYAYHLKTNFDQAIADADQALKLSPNEANYLDTRGWAYLGKGDYDRAIADFNEALRINPNLQASIEGLEKARQGQQQQSGQRLAQSATVQPAQATSQYWTGNGGRGMRLGILGRVHTT